LTKAHITTKIRPVQKGVSPQASLVEAAFFAHDGHPEGVLEVEMAGLKSENELVEIPLETVPEATGEEGKPSQPNAGNAIEGDIVQVNQSNISQITAQKVELRQGGANKVNAEQVTAQQSGLGMIQASSVNVSQSGVGFVRSSETVLEKNSTQVLVTQTATINGGTAGLLVAREVHANPLRAFVVLAQKIDGQVETTLDTRGAILAGLIAGIAAGLVSLVGRLLTQRKR
jgi:hypothetical protein